jgi:hypothetical protein
MKDPLEFIVDGRKWSFHQEQAPLEGGVKLPLIGSVFVEPVGFYAIVDGNKRVWLETEPGSREFESPCFSACMSRIRWNDFNSYEKVLGML